MTLEEAIKESIRKYYESGNDDELEINKLGKHKYDKKYFDALEEERIPASEYKNARK